MRLNEHINDRANERNEGRIKGNVDAYFVELFIANLFEATKRKRLIGDGRGG